MPTDNAKKLFERLSSLEEAGPAKSFIQNLNKFELEMQPQTPLWGGKLKKVASNDFDSDNLERDSDDDLALGENETL